MAKFEPGNKGGPGRPKGARTKLGEAFLEALLADFMEHGVSAIQRARLDMPAQYVRVLASILPKELTGPDGDAIAVQVIERRIVHASD